jgi:hypothetical protein
MKECRLAVDIGASSGRVIAGTFDGECYELSEVYRFREWHPCRARPSLLGHRGAGPEA